jgi:hypothetical protein
MPLGEIAVRNKSHNLWPPIKRAGRAEILLLGALFLLLALVACQPQADEAPTIELQSPQAGIEIVQGERVLVQSLAQDDHAVLKSELWVNGRLYEVTRAQEEAEEPSLSAIQIWEATELGTHTLVVRAYDTRGQIGSSSSVRVEVVPRPPTPTAAPTTVPTVVYDPSCEPSARFVEDVTVPDDTLFNGGVAFRKVWRMSNDGECTWEPGVTWTHIGGALLGAESPVEVELAEPGRIVDVSVDMVAPTSPGTYSSFWRLRRPNGEFFGDQAYVRIIVP